VLTVFASTAIIVYLLWGLEQTTWQYAIMRRMPIVLSLVLSAGMIASATILFQTITVNRLLTPNILGLDALYVLIQTFIVFIFTTLQLETPSILLNFLLSIGLMLIFAYGLYRALFSQKQQMYFILLVGIVLGTLFRSLAGCMQMMLDPNEFALLQGKLFASFNNIQSGLLVVALIIVLLSVPFIYDYFRACDVLLLGRENATNLGVDYHAHTKRIFLIVSLFTAVSTALIGPIMFLGLIVANLSYEMTRTYKHSCLILCATLLGIIFLVGGAFVSERLFNFNMPVHVVINFVGGIYFIYLLVRERAR
jgi:iron complex transport system permease protein